MSLPNVVSPAALLLGSQRPRVSSVPPFATSAGDEAIDLAASAGLFLDDWQQWVLRQSLGEREDGNWSAFEVGLIVPRQNGKGSVLEARELYGLVLGDEELILHSAHLFKTAREAFRRIVALIDRTADLKRKVQRINTQRGDEGVEMRDGKRLSFVARSKGGGRGLSGDCLILDEAFALSDEQMEALMPTMSARPNGQIWYTSSPPLDGATGEVLFGVRRRGEAGASGLAWMDWGVPEGTNLDDRQAWAQANPALGIRMTTETIERERQTLSDEGFGRERLGIWPETADDRAISAELWAELATDDTTTPVKSVLMLDVAPDRRSAAIVGAGVMPDGRIKLRVWGYWPNTSSVVAQAAALREELKPDLWVLHAKSSAAVFVGDLAGHGIEVRTVTVKTEDGDEDRPVRGSLLVMTPEQEALAWGRFVDMARGRLVLHHAEDVPLNVAIAGAATRPVGAGSAWKRRGGTDITALVAATGATWAAATVEVAEPEAEPSAFWI